MSTAEESVVRAKRVMPGVVQHPLGRIVYRVRADRPVRARLFAFAVLAGCVAVLSTAVFLQPDSSGVGTHEQLGLPTCVAIVMFGVPCPTCGMTTAFAHTVRGELWSAFTAHPAGLLLALITVSVAGLSLGVVVTGKVWRLNWYRIPPTRITVAVLMIVLGGWAYKIVTSVILG